MSVFMPCVAWFPCFSQCNMISCECPSEGNSSIVLPLIFRFALTTIRPRLGRNFLLRSQGCAKFYMNSTTQFPQEISFSLSSGEQIPVTMRDTILLVWLFVATVTAFESQMRHDFYPSDCKLIYIWFSVVEVPCDAIPEFQSHSFQQKFTILFQMREMRRSRSRKLEQPMMIWVSRANWIHQNHKCQLPWVTFILLVLFLKELGHRIVLRSGNVRFLDFPFEGV